MQPRRYNVIPIVVVQIGTKGMGVVAKSKIEPYCCWNEKELIRILGWTSLVRAAALGTTQQCAGITGNNRCTRTVRVVIGGQTRTGLCLVGPSPWFLDLRRTVGAERWSGPRAGLLAPSWTRQRRFTIHGERVKDQ